MVAVWAKMGGGGVLEAGEDRAAGEEGEMGDITQKWSIFCNRKKG